MSTLNKLNINKLTKKSVQQKVGVKIIKKRVYVLFQDRGF